MIVFDHLKLEVVVKQLRATISPMKGNSRLAERV
jgi:hypothetical protein